MLPLRPRTHTCLPCTPIPLASAGAQRSAAPPRSRPESGAGLKETGCRPARPLRRAVRCASTPEPSSEQHLAVRLARAFGGTTLTTTLRRLSPSALHAAAEEVAQQGDVQARRQFLRALSHLPGSVAALAAAPFAHDSNDAVAYRWARVMERFGRPETAEVLLAVCHHPNPWVRQAMAAALAKNAAPAAQTAVMAMSCDADPWVGQVLAKSLQHDLSPPATAALRRLLEHDHPVVRHAAIQALGDRAGCDIPACLTRIAVSDGVDWLRHRALRALAQRDPWAARRAAARMPLQSVAARATLLMRFAPEGPLQAASRSMRYLENDRARFGEISQDPFILSDILADPQAGAAARRGALDALLSQAFHALRTPQALGGDLAHAAAHAQIILAQLQDPKIDLLHQLQGLGDTPVQDILPLIDILRRRQPEIRKLMATWLGLQARTPAVVPMLCDMVDDTSAEVRHAVAKALFQCSCNYPACQADILPAIETLSQDADTATRATATSSVRYQRVPRALSVLSNAARDPQRDVRHAALWPLTDWKTLEACRVLALLALDADTAIRRDVARACQHVPSALAVPLIAPLLQDHDLQVRRHLATSLAYHSSPASLQQLDSLRAHGELQDHYDLCRSRGLVQGLLNNADNSVVQAMLHRWVRDTRQFDPSSMASLARCAHPQKFTLLRVLMESPHAAIRREAARALRTQFAAQAADGA